MIVRLVRCLSILGLCTALWAADGNRPLCMFYAGTDDLGRTLPMPGDEAIPKCRAQKSVGIFYFVWHGLNGRSGPYDSSKIVAKYPDALQNPGRWGPLHEYHWWGESLFGYFIATDEWVLRRDVMMLTDAGYDFIVIDESNDSFYPQSATKLLQILHEYRQQGWRVPQVAFVTKGNSLKWMNAIHDTHYRPHPEYKDLWFLVDGKPLMIGNNRSRNPREDVKSYFTTRWAQWPREPNREDGFPWISFERPQRVHGTSLGRSVISVSIAQHSSSKAFSTSAFYGDPLNWTRSYHNGANDPAPDAYLYGYNFAEQFSHAMKVDADMVFVTGWNEWIARRFAKNVITKDADYPYQGPIWFIDQADINNSRDIQPMKGGFGDNYYLQAISLNRRYKGVSPRNRQLDRAFSCANKTIDISGGFAQWDSIDNLYLDWRNDTGDRNSPGYGELVYTNTTGRNDLVRMKVTHDRTNLYFYAETAADITPDSGHHWMNLFIRTGNGPQAWYGYDFVINRTSPKGSSAVIEKCRGGWRWEKVGGIEFTVVGSRLQLSVPFDLLGYSVGDDFSMQFKWADNYQGEGNIWSFYLDGDAAPYGRLNYVYCGRRE